MFPTIIDLLFPDIVVVDDEESGDVSSTVGNAGSVDDNAAEEGRRRRVGDGTIINDDVDVPNDEERSGGCPRPSFCTFLEAMVAVGNVEAAARMPSKSVPVTIVMAVLVAVLLTIRWIYPRPTECDTRAHLLGVLTILGVIQLSVLTDSVYPLWILFAPGTFVVVLLLAVLFRVVTAVLDAIWAVLRRFVPHFVQYVSDSNVG